ncbi:MAG TPA: hypothetical protein VKJ47_11725 [Candidatus Binatia bacterium]|nr:hypothetical protein [Candidatus Binatia bacterium]
MVIHRQKEILRADAEGEFLCVATFLPVQRWRDVLPFLRMTSQVERQLAEAEGLVRYGLRADLLHKRFWTFTVWQGRDAANAFVAAEPHATAVRRFREWAGTGAAFVEWRSAEGSINWDEALRRLQHPTFSYPPPGR